MRAWLARHRYGAVAAVAGGLTTLAMQILRMTGVIA